MGDIHIQRESRLKHIPDNNSLLEWAAAGLASTAKSAEITLRIVNKKESTQLNQTYRHKTGPTNVLAFEYQQKPVRGDIVLCAPLILSPQQWAHLVIHGILHLRGYNHIISREAELMEKQEINILKKLGFENPYLS